MDQYRYTGEEDKEVIELLNTYPANDGDSNSEAFKPVFISSGVNDYYYQDVLIPLKNKVIETDVFCIEMDVARFSESTIYNLKLVKQEEETLDIPFTNYELVSTFKVVSSIESDLTPVGVSLYSKDGNDSYVGRIGEDGLSYSDGILSDKGVQINYHNTIFLLPTWKIDIEDNEASKQSVKIIFSTNYKSNEFDALLLEIQRTSDDKSIITSVNDKNVLGRFLNVSNDNADHLDTKIYRVNNILPKQNTQTIKQIGVWGRSGLPMAINGEEIKIGPSGYFELKNYDITSFGVFALGPEDKFTVDYLYEEK